MASNHALAPSLSFPAYFQALSVLLIWILLLAHVDAQNQGDEVQALLSFKEDNAGKWDVEGYWNNWEESDENPCAWTGVTCTSDFSVLELDFSGWSSIHNERTRFAITLFPTLSSLRDLRQLDLSSNGLSSVQGLNNLNGLIQLDLSSNYLEGFPADICNLTELTRLDLSLNEHMTGPIPICISSCQNLQFIALQQNRLSGQIPSLRGLQYLQSLHLADNQLSGPFPNDLGELTNILVIDVSNNLLNGTIPALPSATKLVQLYLDNNNFTDFEDAWFVGANSSLRRLSVSFNQLEGKIPSAMTDLLELVYLNMSFNHLSGSIPFGFAKVTAKNASSGCNIDLSQNRLTGSIPTDIVQQSSELTGCPSYNLSHNLLNGSIPLDSTKYFCFSVFDLSHNNLSGSISPNMFVRGNSGADREFFGIQNLWLQNNSLSGDIVDVLLGPTDRLDADEWRLENNLLTGDLSRIANSSVTIWANLLDLSNNNIRWSTSEAIPDPILATLESLALTANFSWLRFGDNNFSGTSLPTACSNADPGLQGHKLSLKGLDLSNSHLKGEMSGAFFNSSCLPLLQLLNLSNNFISGPVPNSTFTFPALGSLDLSDNNLSGPLPTIPSNSSFFNQDIFDGNEGLCGPPLYYQCPRGLPPSNYSGKIVPHGHTRVAGTEWWEFLLTIGGSLIIALGSCLVATWRWRVYQKRHQQDADLINTLLERDSAALMPLRELKKATDNFAESARIGEGGFGTVYTGKLNDGSIVAIKRSKREGSDKDKEQFLNEVRILSQVNHRNLVRLLGCCMENKIAVLVFEFVSNGTLQEHLQGKFGADRLSWKQRLNIAVQTAGALTYLHTATKFPIYHRDVKSANILLDEELNAKVADFGISKLAPLQATHVSTIAVQGTMGYIDPEYYTSYRLTDRSDVFSFGVVLLELISAKLALDLSRGGEDSSLVNLASPHIKIGNLQGIIDLALMETYTEPTGHGRESILNVGRLAMRCVDMRSKGRPPMNEVLKDLQNMWVELTHSIIEDGNEENELQNLWGEMTGTRKGFSHSIEEDDHEDGHEDDNLNAQPDHILSFSKCLCTSDRSSRSFNAR